MRIRGCLLLYPFKLLGNSAVRAWNLHIWWNSPCVPIGKRADENPCRRDPLLSLLVPRERERESSIRNCIIQTRSTLVHNDYIVCFFLNIDHLVENVHVLFRLILSLTRLLLKIVILMEEITTNGNHLINK
jgi:hypothetical protein